MLTARQQHCLKGIGITQWQTRSPGSYLPDEPVNEEAVLDDTKIGSTPNPTSPVPPVFKQPVPSQDIPPEPAPIIQQTFDVSDWPLTQKAIEACQNCELGKTCNRKVPGKGNQQADVLIIGEAPGHDEDIQGLPFVGRAGQLLDRMLLAIDIQPQQVYITNILKCRPPNNRDPKVDEIKACSTFLQAQIKLIQPKVVLLSGRISAQNILRDQSPVGKLRDRQHILPDTEIPALVTYHPAYLLRNPAEKTKVWHDLKTLQRLLKNAAD